MLFPVTDTMYVHARGTAERSGRYSLDFSSPPESISEILSGRNNMVMTVITRVNATFTASRILSFLLICLKKACFHRKQRVEI